MSMLPSLFARNVVNVTTNKTLAAADQGIVQNVTADAIVITLPATAVGLHFIIRNGGAIVAGSPAGSAADATVLVAVSPAAADAIAGLGFTATVNKDALNTKATSKVGDEICLAGSGVAGVTAWNVLYAVGTWAREA